MCKVSDFLTPFGVPSVDVICAHVPPDCLRGRLYWSDTTGRAIKRAGYGGAKPEVFLRRGPVGFPEGLAVDWVARVAFQWA